MTYSVLFVGFIGLIAFVWLVVVAFRERLGWGFAVLLLSPLAAILFAIMHWREARIPFLAFMTAGFIQLYLVLGTVRDRGSGVVPDVTAPVREGQRAQERAAAEIERHFEERQRRLDTALGAGDSEEGPRAEAGGQTEPVATETKTRQTTGSRAAKTGAATDKAPADKTPELTLQEHRDIVAQKQAQSGRAAPSSPPPPKRIEVKQAADYIGYAMVVVTTDGVRREGVLEAVDDGVLHFTRYLHAGNVTFEMQAEDIDVLELR